MKRPVRAAYQDTGAWSVSCPHCAAQPGQWCTRDDGQPRRVPCVARVVAGGVIPGSETLAHNFGEPRREGAIQ